MTPKKGRAVLWPSVYSSDPMNVDRRTRHQALPVEAGLKFGANAWIHMYVENARSISMMIVVLVSFYCS